MNSAYIAVSINRAFIVNAAAIGSIFLFWNLPGIIFGLLLLSFLKYKKYNLNKKDIKDAIAFSFFGGWIFIIFILYFFTTFYTLKFFYSKSKEK